jgi:alpha-1,2-mannosyltransferase
MLWISILLFLCCLLHACWKVYRLRHPRRRPRVSGSAGTNLENDIDEEDVVTIGIFHPYCHHGGGGERVLWLLIYSLLSQHEISRKVAIVIYTGVDESVAAGGGKDIHDSSNKATTEAAQWEALIRKVEKQFGVNFLQNPKICNGNTQELMSRLSFVYIRSRWLLDAKYYPFMTLLLQSLGSMLVTLECLLRYRPDIYCDTTGAAFGYPVASWLFQCPKVIAYVHYPIISEDMLQLVRDRRPSYNNRVSTTSRYSISKLKYYYYLAFAKLYSFVGTFAVLVMVNSSWTAGHISSLWHLVPVDQDKPEDMSKLPPNYSSRSFQNRKRLVKIFPPCNTTRWSELPLVAPNDTKLEQDGNDVGAGVALRRQQIILSVGQFRPEKDHRLQILAFQRFLKSPEGLKYPRTKLLLLGSSRNAEDAELVSSLRGLVQELKLAENVEFIVNAPYAMLQHYLQVAAIGLHTMWNEHFGISIVEMMASGLVMVAHRSGGPLLDIVVPCAGGKPTGFLASTEEEFAASISSAVDLVSNPDRLLEYESMQTLARLSCQRFGDEIFASSICREFYALLN